MASTRTIPMKHLRLLLLWLRDIGSGCWRRYCPIEAKAIIPAGWGVLSEYRSPIRLRPELGAQNENRLHNMRLCCRALDGSSLEPGQVLSMRRLVGEPTKARGFRSGPVIVGERLESHLGGGLCQVSTVLFNTALLADLRIVEKHNHSRDIWGEKRFVELGRDAAFVFGRKDLRFENTHSAPVILRLEIEGQQEEGGATPALVGSLWSAEPIDVDVHVESRVVEELQPERRGEGGGSGWIVQTRRWSTAVRKPARITFERTERYEAF